MTLCNWLKPAVFNQGQFCHTEEIRQSEGISQVVYVYVTGMCKRMHIRAPVHTRGGVDHQDPAASGGQGMSLLNAWRVLSHQHGQPCCASACCLLGLQPASGDPCSSRGCVYCRTLGLLPSQSQLRTQGLPPQPGHGAEGGLFPVWIGPPSSVWTTAFC